MFVLTLSLAAPLAQAGAQQDYAAQKLVLEVHDTRREGVEYTSEVLGDQVHTTAQKVELGSRWWVVMQGDEELSAWDFAETTGDMELLATLQKEQRTVRRRGLRYLGLGALVGGAGAGVATLGGEDAEVYGGIVGALGIGAAAVGLVVLTGARGVDDEPVRSWVEEDKAEAAIAAWNAELAAKLGL